MNWRAYERGSATTRMVDSAAAWIPSVGQSFVVWTGATKLWAGTIESVKVQRFAEPVNQTVVEVAVTGYACIMDRRFVTPRYYRGKTPREILEGICAQALEFEIITLAAAGSNDGATHYPVTIAGDTLTYTGSPLFKLQDGQPVRIASAPSTTYFVVSAGAATFKLALTPTGAAVSTGAASPADVLTVIDRIAYNYVRLSDAVNDLANAANYFWWVDEEAVLHFAPASATAAPFNITTSGTQRKLSVETRRTDYRNYQHVRISYDAFSFDTATITGDGATRSWIVGNYSVPPGTVYPWLMAIVNTVKVNGVDKTIGIYQQETGKDWYWSPGDTYIYQDGAGTVLGVADTLDVTFKRMGEDIITASDDAARTAQAAIEGETAVYEEMLDNSSSVDYIGAVVNSEGLLDRYNVMPQIVRYEIRTDGLRPGQLQSIVDSTLGINGSFLITSVTASNIDRNYFWYTVEATSTTKSINALDVFKNLAGGGSGGGGGIIGGNATGGGTTGVTGGGWYTITPAAGNATVNLANGFNQRLVLNGTAVTILAPTFSTGSIIAGMSFNLYLDQDATGGRAMPTFTGGADGFISSTANQISMDATASTGTVIAFKFDGTRWRMDGVPITGSALT